MKNIDILNLKNREKIYNYISDYPGVHLCEIFRRLDLSNSTIRYHIHYLERKNLIISKKTKGYTHFFVSKFVNKSHKEVLSYFRKPVQRNIILYLLVCTISTQKGLSIALNKTSATIKHHIEILEKNNIIEKVPIFDGKIKLTFKKTWLKKYNLRGCKCFYKLTDPYSIYDLFIINKRKFYDDGLTENLLDFYQKFLCYESNKLHKLLDDEQTMSDRVVDLINDLIPIPICC